MGFHNVQFLPSKARFYMNFRILDFYRRNVHNEIFRCNFCYISCNEMKLLYYLDCQELDNKQKHQFDTKKMKSCIK